MREYFIKELMSLVTDKENVASVLSAVENLSNDDIHKLCVIVSATNIETTKILLAIEHLDNYCVEFSVHNYRDLGKYWVKNMIPDDNKSAKYLGYIDWEWLGKDLSAEGVGEITPYGILWN